jgi:hypothetical protein
MPGGIRDSSKTRVRPLFDQLRVRADGWIRPLLGLMEIGPQPRVLPDIDYSCVRGAWEPAEEALAPPISLLSWLIRNVDSARALGDSDPRRHALGRRDPETVGNALRALRLPSESTRPWYVFEGRTCPDVFLTTPDAIVVIEGKRTERGPTTDTKWMAGRHQIWRHIDAAWEVRGHRHVFGCFIVEGGPTKNDAAVPKIWKNAFQESMSQSVLGTSFPHRSNAEREMISRCFIGGTTWQAACRAFGFDYDALPKTTPDRCM